MPETKTTISVNRINAVIDALGLSTTDNIVKIAARAMTVEVTIELYDQDDHILDALNLEDRTSIKSITIEDRTMTVKRYTNDLVTVTTERYDIARGSEHNHPFEQSARVGDTLPVIPNDCPICYPADGGPYVTLNDEE